MTEMSLKKINLFITDQQTHKNNLTMRSIFYHNFLLRAHNFDPWPRLKRSICQCTNISITFNVNLHYFKINPTMDVPMLVYRCIAFLHQHTSNVEWILWPNRLFHPNMVNQTQNHLQCVKLVYLIKILPTN